MPTGLRQIAARRPTAGVPRMPRAGVPVATAATLGGGFPRATCPVALRVAAAAPLAAAILVLILRATM